jgi:hypothetical protein
MGQQQQLRTNLKGAQQLVLQPRWPHRRHRSKAEHWPRHSCLTEAQPGRLPTPVYQFALCWRHLHLFQPRCGRIETLVGSPVLLVWLQIQS